jgi:Protein metal binding site.
MNVLKAALGLLAVAVSIGNAPAGPPPPTVRVQGSVSDRSGGTPVPANGTFQMTFRLYDAAVAGTLVATSGPSPVQVIGGLYNADVSFPPESFSGGTLFLEVQVNAEILTPRIPVVSVPYAYVAAQATGVAPGGVNSASIAPGAVTSVGLAPGSVTPDKLAPCADGQILAHVAGAWVCQPAAIVCDAGFTPGNAASITCYDGPPGTRRVGACKDGISHCVPSGTTYGPCDGAVLPSPEICGNGIDENCNGQIDEPIGPHTTGYGPYYSCDPLGIPGDPSTYSLAKAMTAATAAKGSSTGTIFTTTGSCSALQLVALMGQNSCITWAYQGPTAGTTHVGGACDCPTTSDPTWN